MADARTDQPANDDKLQTKGRKENAAQPLNAAKDNAGAERYPSARADEAVERLDPVEHPRTFDQGPGTADAPTNAGRDPAEGKR